MKLVELVNYFREGGPFEDFCTSHSLDIDSEVIEIFMKKPFSLENELGFFEIEKTGGNIEFAVGGEMYINLFDFYYFLDVIKESNEGPNKVLSDSELANRLLLYAIRDA
ncbi:MAG: hypothetical protein H6581_01930 [Bacteroidia bacterium]|nr:hypothetical protein [Bacteroidia bacterium]